MKTGSWRTSRSTRRHRRCLRELDARYLAGEAAAHAQTWSVIAGVDAGVENRRDASAQRRRMPV